MAEDEPPAELPAVVTSLMDESLLDVEDKDIKILDPPHQSRLQPHMLSTHRLRKKR